MMSITGSPCCWTLRSLITPQQFFTVIVVSGLYERQLDNGWVISYSLTMLLDAEGFLNTRSLYHSICCFRTLQKTAYNGVNNGLTMLLDAEVFDYTSAVFDSEGFVMSILHHLDIPILKQTGFRVHPGQSVQVKYRSYKVIHKGQVQYIVCGKKDAIGIQT